MIVDQTKRRVRVGQELDIPINGVMRGEVVSVKEPDSGKREAGTVTVQFEMRLTSDKVDAVRAYIVKEALAE